MEITVSEEVAKKLLNPENPILVEFKKRAAGTYRHVENVERLCENVGRALELDVNVCKIMGLYHDIGKMYNPQYFYENQQKDFNIHDTLNGYDSYHYVTSHISDMVSILVNQCPLMPIEIIRIMAMHHGDSLLAFAWNKHKKELEEDPDNTKKIEYEEDDFRYHYNSPDNVYSSILMICDQCEAVIQAKTQAGEFDESKAEGIIKGIIEKLATEFQLEKMTVQQVRLCTQTLIDNYKTTTKRGTDGYTEKNGK